MSDSSEEPPRVTGGDEPDDRTAAGRVDPSASLPDPEDVSPDLRRTFWAVVALLNIALLGGTLGIVLAGLVGQVWIGLAALTIGIGAGGLAYYRYRQYKTRPG